MELLTMCPICKAISTPDSCLLPPAYVNETGRVGMKQPVEGSCFPTLPVPEASLCKAIDTQQPELETCTTSARLASEPCELALDTDGLSHEVSDIKAHPDHATLARRTVSTNSV